MMNNNNMTECLSVPPDFTAPGKKYKRQIVLASLAILTFIWLYFGLAFWFLYKAYFLFGDLFSGGRNGFLSFMVALLITFLGVFMLKAIFFLYRKNKKECLEISQEDEPRLFDFIYKIADEVKAPRPHKIFLSNTVNACVFYDISFINLLFPTRKNLEIGLGLVNVLNSGEFKSIIAHEFGHFTQRSMIVGRWVYIAHQVVYQIVARRDVFDNFLNGLSRVDIRIAWIGWLLSVIVWSIRSLVEIFFNLVILTQRALSREMEFHADLVAVSITGSDALINSLYKLSVADEAYENSLNFLNNQLRDKRKITDFYALQENSIAHMRVVLNNPDYGKSPIIRSVSNERTTVFKEQIAQTPKMWSTHPSNIDREKNAKQIYIPANIDEHDAWILFKDSEKTKEKFTSELFKDIDIDTTPLAKDESLEIQSKEFQRHSLLPKYRGIYHNRYVLISNRHVKDIYDAGIDLKDLPEKFEVLYPPELKEQIQLLKNLDEELFMLEGLLNKELTATEGKIIFRSREIKRNELPDVISLTKKEAEIERDKIDRHLKLCRNLHYQAAKSMNGGWDQYLFSLTMLVHYCEHTQKNIEVLSKFFYDTLAVISSYRRAEATDILYLCRAANELHAALKGVFTYGVSIKLNAQVISNLNGKEFSELLEPFVLSEAESANINSWIKVVGSWINLANGALNKLRMAALDELLLTEDRIGEISCSGNPSLDKVPKAIGIEDTYLKHDPDIKREIIKKSDFYSKFHNAEGFIPAVAKYSAAALIVFIAVFFATRVGTSKIVIYNGFPRDVMVYIDRKAQLVKKGMASEISVSIAPEINIKAKSLNGELIESFKQKLGNHSRTYVYNVASSAVIYSWFAYYGYDNPGNSYQLYGAKRWTELEADDYFTAPPESVNLKEGETQTRTVVAEHKAAPYQLLNIISNEEERNNLIKVHAIWEDASSPDILTWVSLSTGLKDADAVVKKRLQLNPFDVPALRARQDLAKGMEKTKVCEEQQKIFLKDPENPIFYYLNCRCIEDEAKKDSAFIEGHKKWPGNAWLAYASGYSYEQHEKWEEAISCFDTVCKHEPSLKVILTDEIKRIHQLIGRDNLFKNKDLESRYLTFVTDVENSTEISSYDKYYAFKLLAKGELDKAVEYANPDTNINGYILRLAAISSGASKSIVDKAIGLSKTQFINSSTIIPAMALASKRNLPLTDFKEALKINFGEYADSIYKFIDLTKHNKLGEANKIINVGNAALRGKMSLLGVLLIGNNAPQNWKLYADRLLFITEKPYLGRELKYQEYKKYINKDALHL